MRVRLLAALTCACVLISGAAEAQQAPPALEFESVPDFLKLPAGTNFGEVSGVAVNSKGHVFVFTRSNSANGPAYGPGQSGYVAALQAYDLAFANFFQRLAADGINQSNTLFVFTADENDHFAGGTPTPADCDGVTTAPRR